MKNSILKNNNKPFIHESKKSRVTRHDVFILAFFFFLSFALTMCTEHSSQPDRKLGSGASIGIDYRAGINYVTHLYTLGGIGYKDQGYVDKFGSYLSPEDRKVLQQYKEYLQFGNGGVGDLTLYFFFIPSYANLQTKNQYKTYFNDLKKVIETKSWAPVEKYITTMYNGILDDETLSGLVHAKTALTGVAHVFVNNIDVYMNEVYPIVKTDLEKQKQYLNGKLTKNDIIHQWQSVTGYEWRKGDYLYLLFRAGKNGPSFNNLADNINSCYYKIDERFLMDMFSHEFGVFLLYDSIKPLMERYQKQYPSYESIYTVGRPHWMAYEMLAIFYNTRIHQRKTSDYYNFKKADPIAFMDIYDALYKQGVRSPRDMYSRAIEKYMEQGGYWENGVEERYRKLCKITGH